MDIGAFEAYTRGFGSKILKQWGWQEGKGLGREENGIPEPPFVRKRQAGQGLGWPDRAHEGNEGKRQRVSLSPPSRRDDPGVILIDRQTSNIVIPNESFCPLPPFTAEEDTKLQNFIQSEAKKCHERVACPTTVTNLQENVNIGTYQNLTATFPELLEEQTSVSPFLQSLELLRDALLASCDVNLFWQALDDLYAFELQNRSGDWKIGTLAFVISLHPICKIVSGWKIDFYNKRARRDALDDHLTFVCKCNRYFQNLVNFDTYPFWSFIKETVFLGRAQRIIEEGWVIGVTDEAAIDVIEQWYPYVRLDAFLEGYITRHLTEYAERLPWGDLFPKQYQVIEIGTKDVIDLTEVPNETAKLDSFNIAPLLPWISFSDFNSEPLLWCLFNNVYKKAEEYSQNAIADAGFKKGLLHFQDIPDLFDHLVEGLVLKKLQSYLSDLIGYLEDPQEFQTTETTAITMLGTFLGWRDIVRDSELISMLEEEFLPSWLSLFSTKLSCGSGDITQFYSRWKEPFVLHDLVYPPVAACFERALHMMRVEIDMNN
eukprot:TRINITY_DN13187_c0_g1_i1.p1 TRINITY_DN13187_c0_g1~~TRINITY_DN13187_c0_g1_i1.p1  ORF type:complete len:543 (+),score=66.44 TRINITY_DN13187_c0_g1_i1:38-1666(+)